MHEMALCQAIADTVTEHAGDRPVRRVEVRIGHLRQVVPDALLFSWELLTDGSPLEGAELAIDHVPATISCDRCGEEATLDMPIMTCPGCHGYDVTLLTGEEFLIVSVHRAKEVS